MTRKPALRKLRRIFGVVAVGIVLAVCLPGGPVSTPTRTVTWSDEFNGPAGTAPDPAKWRYEVGGSGWGNEELMYYAPSTRNASLDGQGHLVITARKESDGYTCWYGKCKYTSARLATAGRFLQKYGRFEARIKIPRGQGLWPAFWMLNNNILSGVPWPNGGEIDILESIGSKPSTAYGSLHGPGYSAGNALRGSFSLPDGEVFSSGFHTFAVDWAPDSLTWYVDGIVYERRTPSDVGSNPWVATDPFFVLLNLAVGGNWPGSPDATTEFPAQMLVDYVRVYP